MVLLGFHFGMSSMITDTFFIPEFIMDTILKTPLYATLYSLVSLLSFVFAFHLVFLFHNLFIGELSFRKSVRKSVWMLQGHRLNFILDATKLAIQIFLVFALMYGAIIASLIGLVYIVPPFFGFNSVSLSILFILNRTVVFIILNAITSINVLFITKKYLLYGGTVPMHHPVEDDRLNKKNLHPSMQ